MDQTSLHTRFRAANDDAARQIGDLPRATAVAVAHGGVDHVRSLLHKHLDTVPLVPIASSTPHNARTGRAA